jgi:Zn-dependent metalloprotease
MLENIKMRGNAQQRRMATHLELGRTSYETKRATATPATAFHGALLTGSGAGGTPKIEIYDAGKGTNLPGTLYPDPSTDPEADQAFKGGEATYNLYSDIYQRDSIDGNGMKIIQTVHYDVAYNNAFWDGTQMVYGDGDGTLFKALTNDLSVIGHELSHGVVQHSGGLIYRTQSGALNESFADVFGALTVQYKKGQSATEADWLVGRDILGNSINGDALRSMKAPGTAYNDPLLGRDPQPYHMDDYIHTFSDNGGVHLNSGIPNHAFYLLAQYLGGNAWEKAGHIWYNAMQTINNPQATFSDWAEETIEQARTLYGVGSKEQVFTKRAWKLVGLA